MKWGIGLTMTGLPVTCGIGLEISGLIAETLDWWLTMTGLAVANAEPATTTEARRTKRIFNAIEDIVVLLPLDQTLYQNGTLKVAVFLLQK
jgi:hypothetical protein